MVTKFSIVGRGFPLLSLHSGGIIALVSVVVRYTISAHLLLPSLGYVILPVVSALFLCFPFSVAIYNELYALIKPIDISGLYLSLESRILLFIQVIAVSF